jgi:magnesium chelatase subunit I
MAKPATLGELKQSPWGAPERHRRTVKDEMRENLIRRLEAGEALFPGVLGYADTVLPQITNAILARQNFILLGLRGQAKSRILRALADFLDADMPAVAGCEINDNPFAPLCRACKFLIAERGDGAPIAWIPREARYVEKLATPDVTIADMIGDVDPIKAARGGLQLSDELTIHYGLLPRANRGIFALNELPDLAGKIQVGLFNILQEGDIQIKGYPIRLPLDLCVVFTANPEDYTARGKIITPLKDRVGSEVRTHYPLSRDLGMAITAQEAWTARRPGDRVTVPAFIREIVEEIAFQARREQKVDKRSGVSQRLPIACMEVVVSNAERRALLHREERVVPRPADIYAALPAITGKLELEYEGELRGADAVGKDLIRAAVRQVFQEYGDGIPLQKVVEWFNQDGAVKLADTEGAQEGMARLKAVPHLAEGVAQISRGKGVDPALWVATAEFILEGLYAHQKISRSEDRGYHGTPQPERGPSEAEPPERPRDRDPRDPRRKRYMN